MNRFAALAWFATLCVTLAESVTRDEVLELINETTNHIRGLQGVAIQRAVAESMVRASNPGQRVCIGRLISPSHQELNAALRKESDTLAAEYGSQSPEQLGQLDLETLTGELKNRLLAAVSPIGNRVNQIRHCV